MTAELEQTILRALLWRHPRIDELHLLRRHVQHPKSAAFCSMILTQNEVGAPVEHENHFGGRFEIWKSANFLLALN